MIRSLYTAATGMEAQQLYMDTISHNLANVNSNGYKRQKVEFQDLMYQTLREPGVRNVEGSVAPAGIEVGLGVAPGSTQRIFAQGSLNQTTNPLDVAIEGEGLFQVSLPDGNIAYTRNGAFTKSADGTLVNSDGYALYPQIVLPEESSDPVITDNGNVSFQSTVSGQISSAEAGYIELARFINPAGLKAIGGNLYVATDASGAPVIGEPGIDGAGTIKQGYLEGSNVQIVDEMVNMISAQRAYEIVSKAIQVSEDMMQVASNLKR